mgnify:CR=1 FL=1
MAYKKVKALMERSKARVAIYVRVSTLYIPHLQQRPKILFTIPASTEADDLQLRKLSCW